MEKKRQIVHIAMVGFAFLLAWLPRWGALLCALAAFLFNLIVMPRLSKATFRENDLKRGFSTGILLYPVSVFILILFFPAYIAAAAWAIMAFGDGLATLFGGDGHAPLAWNPRKTWRGSIVFLAAGTLGAFGLMLYTVRHHGPDLGIGWMVFLSLAGALAAAAVESLDMTADDNLTAPLIAGFTMWVLHFAHVHPAPAYAAHVVPALAVAFAVGFFSFLLGAVDEWGLAGGTAIGFAVYYFAGLPGFLILLLFFILGTLSTKFGRRVKEKRGVAQEKKGRRGLKHALANCAAGAVMAYVFGCVSLGHSYRLFSVEGIEDSGLYWIKMARMIAMAFVAAFAAAAADTVSSEMGQALGKKPVLITTLKSVPHGKNGGITLIGTLLGLLAGIVVSFAGALAGLVRLEMSWLPAISAFVGMNLDSLLGAVYEDRGIVNNEFVNLCCTAGAALFCLAAGMFLSNQFSIPLF